MYLCSCVADMMLTNLEMEMFVWIVFGFNGAPCAPVVPLAESQDRCLA